LVSMVDERAVAWRAHAMGNPVNLPWKLAAANLVPTSTAQK
uniref:Putative NAD(P)-dependent glyceraldehyde-3-phosphate dehydrogenase PS5 (Fragments) n=1 Tax=Pinus strobus TaxID=3348 RepID=PS5_PINST|nr:RecName: Full=Putative NAD(P)-dependent glyceraldehyde-3-phosphate dehydrogenase PS5 [Pinus strobus]